MTDVRCRLVSFLRSTLAIRRAWLLLLAVSSVHLAAAPAAAHSVQPFSFDQLIAEADQVFVGTVSAVVARRHPSGAIVSDVRFSNVTLLKGTADDPLTLVVFGGTLDSETVAMAGFPRFDTGVTYVVFAKDNGRSMFPVVGAYQGLFRVVRAPDGGADRIADAYGNLMSIATGEATEEPLTLDMFVQLIRERLAPGR